MATNRREFLGWLASGTAAATLGCGDDGGTGAVDAAPRFDADLFAPDAAFVCEPTTPDVLGPFFVDGAPVRIKIAGDAEPGERLALEGVVLADDCVTPIAGALLDVWQADVDGVYYDAGDDFRLRGRVMSGLDGRFRVETIKPGNYTLAAGVWRPAHVHFTVSAAGFAPVTTQLYFAGDPFLPPNDGCTTCGSDDPARIIALAGDGQSGWEGEWPVILAGGGSATANARRAPIRIYR